MAIELRALRPSEWDDWYGGLERAFGGAFSREERELEGELIERERALAAWDGERLIGSAGAFSFRMTVPGGALVPTAGVTTVHVAASHRRRGVLRSMMRRQLEEIRDAGREPLAALTASEPGIYGRFGYGPATRRLGAEIDTSRVGLHVPPESDGLRLRMVDDPTSVLAECEAVYARRLPARAGMLERRPGWERYLLLDPAGKRQGASPLACVLAEDGSGAVRGYARYGLKLETDTWGSQCGTVLLRDLEALDPAAYGALWRFLFGIDLTTTLRVRNDPVDAPWLHMVDDWRRCRPRWRDHLFVRPVEVGAALACRTYSTEVDVVLDVADDFCPWNAGRWRLSGDAKGASCERTGDAPELALSVRELGTVVLGGESLAALAGAGRVRELREGALGEASRAFATDLAPWLPHGF